MPESHPSTTDLQQFFRGSLPGSESSRIVRHLLAGCPHCRANAAACWPPPEPEARQLEDSFERALGSLAGSSAPQRSGRSEAPLLLEELERHPPARRLVLARNSRRFRSWSLTELLLERAFEAGFDDPQSALELAELGVELAEALRDSPHPPALVNDLRARARAARGNARRIQGDLAGAGGDLRQAARLLPEGTGDPLEEAFVRLRQAYLSMARRRFQEAIGAFDGVLRLYRLVGEDHWVGRTLIDKGTAVGYSGAPDRAIRLIERGLEMLDPARDPRMALAGKHNLALFRCENGDLERAMSLIKELLPLHAARRERLSLVRLRWLEGRLAQAQSRMSQAEEAYLEVQREFVRRELGFEAALVSLDLAGVYLEQGRSGELKRLAADVLPLFRSLEIHREALVALTLFKRAADREQITLRWIAELSSYLERARANPKLMFKPPGRPPVAGA